jgi:arabinogalactan endo-1,4-beta-galactosidase
LETDVPGYTFLGWSTTRTGSVVTAGSAFTSNQTLYARYTFNPPVFTPPATLNFDIPYDMHPLRTNVPAGWVRGADISNCFEIEQFGGKYQNFNGQVEDIMKILGDAGVNYVRLRLWVNPAGVKNAYSGDGKTDMSVIKVIAARAKAAGMKFLLGYHYSDYWADPGQQYIPASWNVTTAQQMFDKVEEYTAETIQEFIDAGARPDMVALGNEVTGGLLYTRRTSANSNSPPVSNQYRLSGWSDYANAFQAGSRAVRSFGNDIKIMIQFDKGGVSNQSTWDQFTRRANGTASTTGVNVDYDMIGLSWYTYWSSHGSLSNLYTQIGNLKSTFGKEVVVCESGFGFDFGDDRDYPPGAWKVNFKQGFTDNLSNVYGKKNSGMESQGATRLSGNTQRHVADSGIPYTISSFAGNAENQARGYRAFMDAVAAAGGAGVMWWGADWFAPVMGLNSNVENSALFDFTGRALPALRVLGGIKGPDKAKPGKVTGLAVTVSGSTANLTWDTVNTAITNKYRIERATSASGPWTTVDDNITGNNTGSGTYSDTSLAEGTTYYYRVSANNAIGWGVASDTKQATAAGYVPVITVGAITIDTVALSWNARADATAYELQRGTSSSGPWTTISNSLTDTTYTDTGRTPATAYYYQFRAYAGSWGNYSAAATATTTALATPTGLRVTGTTAASLSLAWNAVSGAASYKLYGAQAASAPADSAYALVADIPSGATYTHNSLTEGAVWWYKVSAVYATHGEGAKSAAASGKVGALDLKATISMSTGTLDADFLDSQKAASSTDAKPYTGSDTVINYTIVGMYVANDADNLYVALDFGDKVPIGYNYDRFVVWVSNTSSNAAGATVGTSTGTGSGLGINDGRITNGQTITGTIHGWAYRMFRNSAAGGSTGRAFNIGTWSNPGSDNWVWQPGGALAGSRVFKVSIPLAQIGGAVAGNELRVFGAFSQGHGSNSNNVGVGSLIPSAAAPGATCSSGTGDITSVTVNMNNALAYTVK